MAMFHVPSSTFTLATTSTWNLELGTPTKPVIAINPGHGGADPGASHQDSTGKTDLVEKDLNLQVARRLADLLEANGYPVMLLRDGDYALVSPLNRDQLTRGYNEGQARVDLANASGAAVYVHLHFNSWTDKNLRGTSVYYADAGPLAAQNRKLAEFLHAGLLARLRESGYNPPDLGVLDDLTIGRSYGRLFALGGNTRLTRGLDMPTALGEPLFLSNEQEAALLKKDSTLQAVAQGYYDGIVQYLKWAEAEGLLVSPRVSAAEIERGPTGQRKLALTFDAGADAQALPTILDALRARHLRATFFLTGQFVRSFPDLVRRIAAEGHELGNHSDTHPDLTTLPDRQVVAELARAEAAVMAVTNQTTRPWFRPPLGARDERIRDLAAAMGYRTVYWTLDSTDWRAEVTAAMLRQRVLQYASDGAIIVFHVGSQATAEALPSLLDDLITAGYHPVALSELLAH